MTFKDYAVRTQGWGVDKGLNKPSVTKSQLLKVLEEMSEIYQAMNPLDSAELIDALGDTNVTLIVADLCADAGALDLYLRLDTRLGFPNDLSATELYCEMTTILGKLASVVSRFDLEANDGVFDGNTKDTIQIHLVELFILTNQLARLLGFTPVECLKTAYEVIALRKGVMVGDVFVKEEDFKVSPDMYDDLPWDVAEGTSSATELAAQPAVYVNAPEEGYSFDGDPFQPIDGEPEDLMMDFIEALGKDEAEDDEPKAHF